MRRAREAAPVLAELTQEQIDAIVDAMAAAVTPHAEALARLAQEETGYGVVADKIQKNLFSSEKIYRFIRPMKTVGVVNRIEDRKVITYGATREQAIRRMQIALSEMVVEGILTNIPLHRELMVDARFIEGGTNIHYLEHKLADMPKAGK